MLGVNKRENVKTFLRFGKISFSVCKCIIYLVKSYRFITQKTIREIDADKICFQHIKQKTYFFTNFFTTFFKQTLYKC